METLAILTVGTVAATMMVKMLNSKKSCTGNCSACQLNNSQKLSFQREIKITSKNLNFRR